MMDLESENTTGSESANSVRRRLFRVIGVTLLVLALLLGVYGTVAYIAWQQGQSLQVENARQALNEQLSRQMELAREEIEAGNFALAIRRLEWVLEQNADYPGSLALRQEAQVGLNNRLTPSPVPTNTATPEVEPTADPGPDPAPAFADLERLMEEEEWGDAAIAIPLFQGQFPGYQRRETDSMLYDAYVNLGLSLVTGNRIELGLFYLEQAEKLGDLPLEAEDHRSWAELYLLGIGYYGVDWGTTLFYFRGLCAAAPFYQDACAKLYDALIAYGGQYAAAQDYCPAEELYAEAIRLENSTSLAEKLEEAGRLCLEATPTPTVPITDTTYFNGALPLVSDEF